MWRTTNKTNSPRHLQRTYVRCSAWTRSHITSLSSLPSAHYFENTASPQSRLSLVLITASTSRTPFHTLAMRDIWSLPPSRLLPIIHINPSCSPLRAVNPNRREQHRSRTANKLRNEMRREERRGGGRWSEGGRRTPRPHFGGGLSCATNLATQTCNLLLAGRLSHGR